MNGIGGSTIAEAMDRLSFAEFMTWVKFRQKRGSLHQGMRIERSSAMLAALYANAHSKERHSVFDFMPHEEEPDLTLEEAMQQWA